jgi:hypothetical protein
MKYPSCSAALNEKSGRSSLLVMQRDLKVDHGANPSANIGRRI